MLSSLEMQTSASRGSSSMTSAYQKLEHSSIETLFAELDSGQSGFVSRSTITQSLLNVYHHLAPFPKPYHLIHANRTKDWDVFVDSLFMSESEANYNLEEFKVLVDSWNLPAILLKPKEPPEPNSKRDRHKQGKLSHFLQRVRTRCSTNAPRYIFIAIVLCLLISLALWQLFQIFNDKSAKAAFGPGVLVAKAASGALYPTLTLLVFSMSRWAQHFLRQSKYLRRFVDWEYAQSFHIKMACLAFLLGFIHAVSHLSGTYRYALHHPQALFTQISSKHDAPIPTAYVDFMKWRASWTGLTSLGLFTIMSICGLPSVRKKSFELFQLSHLLMYPLFVMLLIHGSSAILQKPILGWWLLLPILFVVTERLYRLMRGFIPLQATVVLADDNMVALSIKMKRRISKYRPGQYIFLQIPVISRLQWHPFTVSKITEDSVLIHIRTSAGDWTCALWKEAIKSKILMAAVDGPYGSPSREFYRYDNTIIFGAGIGITPFSAILSDLFDKLNSNRSPWENDSKNVGKQLKLQDKQLSNRATTKVNLEREGTDSSQMADRSSPTSYKSSSSTRNARYVSQLKAIWQKRSISLHWTVKTSQDLQWLSLLLNQLTSDLSVKINIHLYVTQSHKDDHMSTLVFRSLLDHRRIESLQTTSILTGLLQTCHFTRPDLEGILDDYHQEYSSMDSQERPRKVGVIYCGPVSLGRMLSRKCEYLTSQARAEGARLRYFYHSESF